MKYLLFYYLIEVPSILLPSCFRYVKWGSESLATVKSPGVTEKVNKTELGL